MCQFSCSIVFDSATPWTAAHQASLSITNSQSLLRPMNIELVMPSNHLTLCHPLLFLPSIILSIRVFPNESVFHIGATASASVLPVNIQYWFPLWWTGLISLQSKGLSRVFSSTTVWKHQFFGAQPSVWNCTKTTTLTSMHDCWKNHRFDYMDHCQQRNVSAF